ncbi:MAG: glycosyltransferase family 9 protein [Nitrospirae bacterium]|nr:glycosyltransferase family 9 protein [Nitrospirota bacterium]
MRSGNRDVVRSSERDFTESAHQPRHPRAGFAPTTSRPRDFPTSRGRVLFIRLSSLGDVVRVLPVLAGFKAAAPGVAVGLLTGRAYGPLFARLPLIDRLHLWPGPSASDGTVTQAPGAPGARTRAACPPKSVRRGGLDRREARGYRERASEVGAPVGRGTAGFEPADLSRQMLIPSNALRTLREIRGIGYERCFNLHPGLRSGLITGLLGIRESYGFGRTLDREGGFLFSRHTVDPPAILHRVDQYIELLRVSGTPVTSSFERLALGSDSRSEMLDRFVRANGLEGAHPVALFPGSSGTRDSKRWPEECYGEVARLLRTQTGCRVVVVPGLGETDLARRVAERSGGAALLAPEWGLADLASFLASCDLVVGGDTGPIHLADALGVPVVAIFGPTDPAVYGPRGARAVALGGRPGTGRPHRGHSRRLAPPTADVTVEQVVNACAESLR